MVRLKPNADVMLRELLSRNAVLAYYKSVCDAFTNDYENTFITDFQIFITKIGICVSRVSSGIYISTFYQSIKFLCIDVLENPDHIKTFKSLGVNLKGNFGKHTINENHIEMSKCVAFFNTFLISISEKCGLPSLKKMIIRKNKDTIKPIQFAQPIYISQPTQPKRSYNSIQTKQQASSCAKTVDEYLTLSIDILSGIGKYEKGLIKKVPMFNFKLKININNPSYLKISKLTAIITSNKKHSETITLTGKITEIDIPTDLFGNKITATVIASYKIGLLKQKEIKTTATRVFGF